MDRYVFGSIQEANMRTTVRTAVIGKATLNLIEEKEDGEPAPRYYLERIALHTDGTQGPRVIYGEQGFSNPDEAFEFGQQWCLTLVQSQA